MNEPLDLAPELAREQRIKDLELMRKLDKKLLVQPVTKYEIKDVLAEMNLRYVQYGAFNYPTDFKVLQVVQDFQYIVTPLQGYGKKRLTIPERMAKAKVDYSKPVAMLKEKPIYANVDGEKMSTFTFDKPS